MVGFLFTTYTGVRVFIESKCKTKCKSVIERVKDTCYFGYSTVGDVPDEHIKSRLKKGELIKEIDSVVFLTGSSVEVINESLLIVQTLKEYEMGSAWLEREDNEIRVVMSSTIGSNKRILGSFNNINDAMNYLCSITNNKIIVHIYRKVVGKDMYAPIGTAFNLNDLENKLWKLKNGQVVFVSAMVSWGGSNTSVRICKVENGKVIEDIDKYSNIALKHNKVFKNSIMPAIIKVVEKVYSS